MRWDPNAYLRFADHRTRPGIDLLMRTPPVEADTVLDLGCGTGDLTDLLGQRWPTAELVGIDSSPEMLTRARLAHPDITWLEADIARYEPDELVDVVFSNAALHWLDDHESLFGRLRSWLRPGGVLAIQMPANWKEPTHTIPAAILDEGRWPAEAASRLLRDRLADPSEYATWVQPAEVDMWETTYHQLLTGTDPVLEWVSGSVLRPVLGALDGTLRERFREACREGYRAAYPARPDGTTLLPFRRFFLVAVTR